MPDIFDLIRNWWKQVMLVVLVSVITIGIITFLKKKEYLSVATAVPASSFASDKSRVFNENIQALYSALGTPDDLDLVLGTAALDTVYLAVAQQFNLWDHYKISETGPAAITKSASELKKRSKVMKSEYGELKVKVWDTDSQLAASLANAIIDQLQKIHQYLNNVANQSALESLKAAKTKSVDSANATGPGIISRSAQYDKLIGEYQMMVDSKPPALIIVERARASEWPDRPRLKRTIAATALLSLLFGFLAALVLEARKNRMQVKV